MDNELEAEFRNVPLNIRTKGTGVACGVLRCVVDILGTKYKIYDFQEQDEFMKENDYGGYTDFDKKEIKFVHQNSMALDDVMLRHEIIHAFLYESGIDLGMQFHNEECVDFFAMQFVKLTKIIQKGGGM